MMGNSGHGIQLGFDSSAFLEQATVTNNYGYGVYCEGESRTIDMPTTLTGNTLGWSTRTSSFTVMWCLKILLCTSGFLSV